MDPHGSHILERGAGGMRRFRPLTEREMEKLDKEMKETNGDEVGGEGGVC
jgi:hypothetical protein